VSGTEVRQDGIGHDSRYFFLSYAHSPPLEGSLRANPDRWVRKFFGDLTISVERHASRQPRLAPGFFDQDIPLSSDWKASLTRALSTAEVFVPLYSPGYFARSWPGREWACFMQRLAGSGLARPEDRFVPILWIPLPAEQDPPGLRQALAVGASEAAYAENGLRALLRLTPYRASYDLVVDRLAAKIVELAETAPLPRSAAPDIDAVTSPFKLEASTAVFTVTVAAPSRAHVVAERDPAGYGDRGIDWRAYPRDQELPLADYAAWVAEQLDFAVQVDDIENAAASQGAASARNAGATRHGRPGIVLIDPWLVARDGGAHDLRSFVSELPSWVLPLLVLGSDDDERGSGLADRARAILGDATLPRTELAKRSMRGVGSLGDFVALMPSLIAEAERQYLRHGPVLRTPAHRSRPLMAAEGRPANPTSSSESSQEQSDA
jgi:FxsC-like protein